MACILCGAEIIEMLRMSGGLSKHANFIGRLAGSVIGLQGDYTEGHKNIFSFMGLSD